MRRLRRSAEEIVTDLRSSDDSVTGPAIVEAEQVLGASTSKRMHAPHRRRPGEGILYLPPSQRLTDDEIDLLVDALLELVARDEKLSASAAWALHRSTRTRALPHLAEALKRWAPWNVFGSLQAIVSIWDLILQKDWASVDRPSEDIRFAQEAISALKVAAGSAAISPLYDPRTDASSVLKNIERRFSPPLDVA